MSNAVAAVAAEIIPGRPPKIAVSTAMQNDAYSPTFGSTPAMIENAIASGMSASATTNPASKSPRTLENHSLDRLLLNMKSKGSDEMGSNGLCAARSRMHRRAGTPRMMKETHASDSAESRTERQNARAG